MSECDSIRDLLVLHAEGFLTANEDRRVGDHLDVCAGCRAEADGVQAIRERLSDPAVFAPEETYAWQKFPETVAMRAGEIRRSRLPVNFASMGWALSLAATVVLGFALISWLHRMVPRQEPAAAVRQMTAAPGNAAFVNRIYAAHAREATSGYLAACQDLLLNTLRAEPSCEKEKYDVSAEVVQARQLLQRKRLLDPDLDVPEVAHARGLCDELEGFLLNLSLSDRCETPDRMRRLERYVQRQQLLLRIRVVQGELS